MNRLALVSDDTISAAPPVETSHPHHQTATIHSRIDRGFDVPYTTFAPIHYEERYAYPLIVWLHDDGSNERELKDVMPLISMRNYVAIAPRGTCGEPDSHGRFCWRQSSDAIESAQSRIVDCIAVARRRFNIHDKRVFLVGRGAGGTMAIRTAWQAPDQFAGVVTINGPLPSRLSPLRRVNELRQIPCLLTTSRDSEIYPTDHVCRDLRLLHVAGCTVALRQYPGGDSLTSNMLSDLDRWLMELVCGSHL
jgi:phospholipase/carboxylesterase